MQRSLIQGNALNNVIFFALPFVLSYFLQTLYGLADLFIIGQFNGVAAITAVSIGSQVMHMLTVMIVGLSMGTTVLIARNFGAKAFDKVSHVIGNSAVFFFGLSVVLTLVLLIANSTIVQVMKTPTEAVDFTVDYLMICFLGVPFVTGYNIIASIFRGLGDSKSPMYIVMVACVVNIILDIILIGPCNLGPKGAALATTLSQMISVFIGLVYLKRHSTNMTYQRGDFVPQKVVIGSITKIGLPIALQDGFIQIGFIIITIIANMRGLTDAAAVGIVEKVICLVFLVPSALLSTVSAIAAQCVGAQKHLRAKLTLKYASYINCIYSVVVFAVVLLIPEIIISWFVKEGDEGVIRSRAQYLSTYIFDVFFAGIHFVFSGFFCAYGRSMLSFIHNIISMVCFRVPGSYLGSVLFPTTLTYMGLATPVGSFVSMLICFVFYHYLKKQGILDGKKLSLADDK